MIFNFFFFFFFQAEDGIRDKLVTGVQTCALPILAPKSNAVYTAYGAVLADIEATAAEPVPLHLRNAPTKLMKELDYGRDYQYAHDVEGRVADMECLPPSLIGRRYYHPTGEGREKLLAQRMDEISRIKAAKRK